MAIDFGVDIKITDGQTAAVIANVTKELDRMERAAQAATRIVNKGLADGTIPAGQAKTAVAAYTKALSDADRGSVGLSSALKPLAQGFQGLASAIQAEQSMLERIRGPMRQHQEDVLLLTNMYKRGVVSSQEYIAELQKIDQRGPGAKQQTSHESGGFRETGAELLKSHGGGVGGIASGVMEGGIGSLLGAGAIGIGIGAVHKLAEALVELGDRYTELANKAEKIRRSGESVQGILDAQRAASVQLHTSLEGMLELITAVREGTEEMNLTSREQQNLAMSVGAAIRVEGKEIGEAHHLLETMSFAMANGTMTGRELKGILKQYPELAAELTESTGHTRGELIKMANQGKFTGQDLADGFNQAGIALQEKLGDRMETVGEKMDHLKDRVAVGWGRFAQMTSFALGKMIDAVGDLVDPAEKLRTEYEQQMHALVFEEEIQKKMVATAEHLVQVQQTHNAAKKLGMDVGSFDADSALNYERLKATMAELGIVMKDVWTDANTRQVVYDKGLQDMIAANVAKRQAEDVKSIAIETDKLNSVLDDQAAHWRTITDDVNMLTKAVHFYAETRAMIAKAQASKGDLIGAGLTLLSPDRDEVEDLRKLDKQTLELSTRNLGYGKTVVDIKNKTMDHKNAIDDLAAAHRAGMIVGKEYYDALKALGVEEGRVSTMLKEILAPQKAFTVDMAALIYLYSAGRISAAQYQAELVKIVGAFDKTHSAIVLLEPDMPFQKQWKYLEIFIDGLKEATDNANKLRAAVGMGPLVLGQERTPGSGAGLAGAMVDPNTGLAIKPGDDDLFNQREARYKQQNEAAIKAQLYSGDFNAPRNNSTFTANQNDNLQEAALYTKRWNEELANNKNKWADVDKFGSQALGHIEDAMVQLVTTGKFSFKSLVDSILADLAKLAAHRLLMSIIGGISGGGGFSNVLPGTNMPEQSFPGMFGGHAASGGDWRIGGSSPSGDKLPFMAMVNSGESVHIRPAGAPFQMPSGAGNPANINVAAAAPARVVVSQNPRDLIDALGTTPGEQQVVRIALKYGFRR